MNLRHNQAFNKLAIIRAIYFLLKNSIAKYFVVFIIAIVTSNHCAAGSWQYNQSAGGFSNVNIYTPDSYSPIGPEAMRSLLMVLHGCTQPINSYNTANLETAAEAYGMVIAVPDAQHKEGFSCWAYWSNSNSGAPARNKRDYENLIQLAEEFTSDPTRRIDRNQVYIAGLSSGAAFANTTACLAPDIFAGMGISAGPSIGTSSSGAVSLCESANVASRCINYAGSYTSHFATQIASIAQANDDGTVNTCYNTQNSEGMAAVYGVNEIPGSNTIGSGANTATETLWQNGRVSRIWFNGGVGHAWSGGSGASGSFISGNSINYAMYLGDFFTNNNQRVDRNSAPIIEQLTAEAIGNQIQITATVTDLETNVASATAVIVEALNATTTDNVNLPGSNNVFSGISPQLSDGLYQITIMATDDQGGTTTSNAITVRIGPEPPAQPPELNNITVTVNGQCAMVTGNVLDGNLNVEQVAVTFSNGELTATLTGSTFAAQSCELTGGDNTATIIATDSTDLTATETISFNIDAGQTATLDEHISAGRLDYSNYANCYLEYGAQAFKLDEIIINSANNTCSWQDTDASCTGPQTSCSNGNENPDNGDNDNPDNDNTSQCQAFTDFNYNHKAFYGRAYSTGNILAPNYFAVGSDQALSGSTYGLSTLHSTDGGAVWLVGECP